MATDKNKQRTEAPKLIGSKPRKRKYHRLPYVERKVAHMKAMGIAASIYKGAATPDWLKERLEAQNGV